MLSYYKFYVLTIPDSSEFNYIILKSNMQSRRCLFMKYYANLCLI